MKNRITPDSVRQKELQEAPRLWLHRILLLADYIHTVLVSKTTTAPVTFVLAGLRGTYQEEGSLPCGHCFQAVVRYSLDLLPSFGVRDCSR